MKLLLNFVIIFIISISVISCSSKNKEKIIEHQYYYTSCGKINRQINFENESTDFTNYKNESLLTRNLIKMDNKLQEAFSIIDCYEKQIKK